MQVTLVRVGEEAHFIAEELGQVTGVRTTPDPREQRRAVGGSLHPLSMSASSARRMAITVCRSTRSTGRPIPRSDSSESVATSSDSFTGGDDG